MRKLAILAVAAALSLGGCATGDFGRVFTAAQSAVTNTVPAEAVVPVANTFDILKIAAANFAGYCVQQRKSTGAWPSLCSKSTRSTVAHAVNAGTAARNQLEVSLDTGQPALSSAYNTLLAAVAGLKQSPAASPQFQGAQ